MFLILIPNYLGEMIQFDDESYVSDELKPPK